MVVVNRLTKYAHFITLHHPFSAATVAEAFLSNMFKLHGMPMSIVSDRDAIFLSNFWQSFFMLQISYHLQSDVQTEVVNKCLET